MKQQLLTLTIIILLQPVAAFTALPASRLRPRSTPPVEPMPAWLVTNSGGRLYAHPQSSDASLMEFLGAPHGLVQTFRDSAKTFALRLWLLDDSGSMTARDGARHVEPKDGSTIKMVRCTRWKELQETARYHAQLSGMLPAPTLFRLINDGDVSQSFTVAWDTKDIENNTKTGSGESSIDEEVLAAHIRIDDASPSGLTPLTERVKEVRAKVESMAPTLHKTGSKVCLVLATDGLPTKVGSTGLQDDTQDFVKALSSLQGLPMWLVVRLCTNEDDVVDFYGSLDSQLEYDVEVLDDYLGEAQEIHKHNPYLTYALPLHRLREMGGKDRVFDLLDERKLTKDELLDYCMLLFGKDSDIPDPEVDWLEFKHRVNELQRDEIRPWNPISKRKEEWIDLNMY